jgi:hypothetical protein
VYRHGNGERERKKKKWRRERIREENQVTNTTPVLLAAGTETPRSATTVVAAAAHAATYMIRARDSGCGVTSARHGTSRGRGGSPRAGRRCLGSCGGSIFFFFFFFFCFVTKTMFPVSVDRFKITGKSRLQMRIPISKTHSHTRRAGLPASKLDPSTKTKTK